jgi:hypothetical protein
MAFAIYLVFCSILGFGTGVTIAMVGQPRKPITPGVALATTIVGVLEFAALSYLYFN